MSAASAGARPVCTARSSIAGLSPSMTTRTSFFGIRWRVQPSLTQDAQARVLLTCLAAAADQQPGEEAERQDRHGRGEDAEADEREADGVEVDGQRRAGRG